MWLALWIFKIFGRNHVNGHYLHIWGQLITWAESIGSCCWHSQWAQSMGVAMMPNKDTIYDTCRLYYSIQSTATDASFSSNLTDSLCLWIAQVPRSQDLLIFCGQQQPSAKEPITLPLIHAQGIITGAEQWKLIYICGNLIIIRYY